MIFCKKNAQIEDTIGNLEIFMESLASNDRITAKFIEIPLVPSLSKLPLDSHEVRAEKTAEIRKYNDELLKWNAKTVPQNVQVPSLARAGLRKEKDTVFPRDHVHVPELWARWDALIKDKNCVHLADHVKRAFWIEVRDYFAKTTSCLS